MGCFNAICPISGLTIYEGDKARMVLLTPKTSGYRTGYSMRIPADLYFPVALPIAGEYNDYGTLEKVVENTNTARLTDYFDKMDERGKLVKDKYFSPESGHKVPLMNRVAEFFSANLLVDYTFMSKRHLPVTYTLISEEAWQYGVTSTFKDYESKGQISAMPMLLKEADEFFVRYQELSKIAAPFFDDASKVDRNSPEWKIAYEAHAQLQKWCIYSDDFFDNSFSSFYGQDREYIEMRFFENIYENFVTRNIRGCWTLDSPEWIDLRQQMCEFAAFNFFMDRLGKYWLPFLSGSQGHEMESRRLEFSKAMQKIQNTRVKNWNKEMGY